MGGRGATWGGGGPRGYGDSRRGGMNAPEDWSEERRIASRLVEKVVRKVSMKRWFEIPALDESRTCRVVLLRRKIPCAPLYISLSKQGNPST